MLLTAIRYILSKLKPYTPEGYLDHCPVNESRILTKAQALELLGIRGYTITDDPTVTT